MLRGGLRPWSRKGPDQGVGVDPSLLILGTRFGRACQARFPYAQEPLESPVTEQAQERQPELEAKDHAAQPLPWAPRTPKGVLPLARRQRRWRDYHYTI